MDIPKSTARDILHRDPHNPILTLDDLPFEANSVFNGSPIKIDGRHVLLLRVEGQQGFSFFALAESDDGVHFSVEPDPVLMPATDGPWRQWESKGIEDPRITYIDGRYYVLYTAVGDHGYRIAIAVTDDFHTFERLAPISETANKDGVLFPEKINGLYARLDRPFGNGVGAVWISYSPDLLNWGASKRVFAPRRRLWDSFRIGASVPPIRTDSGWLEIYHGVKMTQSGPIYRAGAILLAGDDPSKVVGRALSPVLSPREDYERIGDVGNVVFACGAIVEDDRTIRLYYGAADTAICVATGNLDEIIALCTREA